MYQESDAYKNVFIEFRTKDLPAIHLPENKANGMMSSELVMMHYVDDGDSPDRFNDVRRAIEDESTWVALTKNWRMSNRPKTFDPIPYPHDHIHIK